MHGRNLFSVNDSVTDPLKTLFALNHLNDHLSLNRFVVLDDVRFKLLITTSNLSNDIVCLLFKMDLVDTNQEKASFDVNDRDSNIQLIDQLFDLMINLEVPSLVELDGWFVEKNMALFFDLSIRDSSVLSLRMDEVLVESVVIDLLLSDSSNHLFLLHVQVSQVRHEFDLFIVVEFEKSLSLLFFDSSSLQDSIILLICLRV
jgi:hypothetical protein